MKRANPDASLPGRTAAIHSMHCLIKAVEEGESNKEDMGEVEPHRGASSGRRGRKRNKKVKGLASRYKNRQ